MGGGHRTLGKARKLLKSVTHTCQELADARRKRSYPRHLSYLLVFFFVYISLKRLRHDTKFELKSFVIFPPLLFRPTGQSDACRSSIFFCSTKTVYSGDRKPSTINPRVTKKKKTQQPVRPRDMVWLTDCGTECGKRRIIGCEFRYCHALSCSLKTLCVGKKQSRRWRSL